MGGTGVSGHTAPARPPRRALVLGGGGVLGYAWTLGALSAVEQAGDFDARDVDVVVGTSAGAIVAAMLGCGLSVAAMCRHHQGVPQPGDPVFVHDYDGVGGAQPPYSRPRPGAPELLLAGLRHPRRTPLTATLAGLLPAGRASLSAVRELVGRIAADAGFAERWPSQPRPWIVALDQSTGRRVVFGRDDVVPRVGNRPHLVREARLADAVTASCSVPGWYPPVAIDGTRYCDGGVASNASADVLLGTAVEEAYVLAPMAGLRGTRPTTSAQRIDRALRRWVSRSVARDVIRLREQGVRVRVLAPEADELAVIGVNLMDPSPRLDVLTVAQVATLARLSPPAESLAGAAGAGGMGGAVS